MNAFAQAPDRAAGAALRALARLIDYPDGELRQALPELRATLHAARRAGAPLSDDRLAELDRLARGIADSDPLDAEAEYVRVFDSSRACSLHLFEHVHGDSRERGPALVDLRHSYEQAGLLLAPDELPDYLPAVLEFASTQPATQTRGFLGELTHILNAIHSALLRLESPYAPAIAAIVELAGEELTAVAPAPEPALDALWEEPPAFDGCTPYRARPLPVASADPVRLVGEPPRVAAPVSSNGALS
ncbi:MAG TPA: nitrate reductase molybdenum cofactor assembly chaperone [Pseudomonadales bacterium]|nr:nitrate reductase molybdenum cofactor assembly chaperone [Pseudomonadales bacterium]HND13760.1 nitrate reductase molybdenum cofactor assembly chaperone [Pseudomonadales bacterium]